MIEVIPNTAQIGDFLSLAERYGLGFEYNDFFQPDLLDDKEALKERIKFYRGLGRNMSRDTMHGAFLDVLPFSREEVIRRHSLYRMEQSIEIAQQLGVRGVVFHTNLSSEFMFAKHYREDWLEYTSAAMEKLLRVSEHVEIYVENMLDNSPEYLASLASRLAGEKRFGICLDIAHLILKGGRPDEWLTQLAPYIRHVHLNDNNLQADEHLALGQGKIRWDEILPQIHKCTGASILIEVNGIERAAQSIQYLERKDEIR